MPDPLDRAARSALMARIRGADTTPEWILRSGLHRLGFRFRLHAKGLPGRPDLLLRAHRAALFVHGCFWHRHPGCRHAASPKGNAAYWQAKFDANCRRDARNQRQLRALGWRVKVVWECQLNERTLPTLLAVARWLLQEDPDRTAPERCPFERRELLRAATGKVRERIDGYGKGKGGAGKGE